MFYAPTKNLNYAVMNPYSYTGSVMEISMSYHRLNPYDFFNGGTISGTIKIKDTPNKNTKVILYESELDNYISETLTNDVGYFEFKNLNKSMKFHILIINSNTRWEHRTISRLTPV